MNSQVQGLLIYFVILILAIGAGYYLTEFY